ncbi:hypothetical protein [Mesobacterium pallidum]|nr:hypothetical protein [Mesobacterium pallidum]
MERTGVDFDIAGVRNIHADLGGNGIGLPFTPLRRCSSPTSTLSRQPK